MSFWNYFLSHLPAMIGSIIGWELGNLLCRLARKWWIKRQAVRQVREEAGL
jgi:hypothetical protein